MNGTAKNRVSDRLGVFGREREREKGRRQCIMRIKPRNTDIHKSIQKGRYMYKERI